MVQDRLKILNHTLLTLQTAAGILLAFSDRKRFVFLPFFLTSSYFIAYI
jgi:hypothetical protein